MTNITIDVVFAYISDDYEPTDTELLILRDIINDQIVLPDSTIKDGLLRDNKHRLCTKDVCFWSKVLFGSKINIYPERLSLLSDKKRLLIKNNKSNKSYKQRF